MTKKVTTPSHFLAKFVSNSQVNGTWVASSALLTPKNRRRRIPEIRVGTDQCPKLVSGTKNGIDASGFVSSAIVKQQPVYLAVGCAWKGSESCAWSDSPCSVVSAGS